MIQKMCHSINDKEMHWLGMVHFGFEMNQDMVEEGMWDGNVLW